ncbi:MAG TPA: GlxA family transcriptional regulator [Herbaspirillum sp.]
MNTVGLIVYPKFQVLGLAMCPAFELANIAAGEAVYSIELLSEHGGLVPTSAGFDVQTAPFDKRRFDTLIVMGDNDVRPTSPGLTGFLRKASSAARRVASICTGSFALAEAGLLDGRRATTHWGHAKQLQQSYPNVKVEEDRIFINDGNIWTSAGMSACVDLALALVEDDLGSDLTRLVSRRLVLYHRRSGGQSQFSVMQDLAPKTDRIQKVLTYAKQNLQAALSVEELAGVANLSPRQFSRVFHEETEQSPARAIENLRVESARLMLESGGHTIDEVATSTGFGDSERMRRAFLRAFGQPPLMIQRAARG